MSESINDLIQKYWPDSKPEDGPMIAAWLFSYYGTVTAQDGSGGYEYGYSYDYDCTSWQEARGECLSEPSTTCNDSTTLGDFHVCNDDGTETGSEVTFDVSADSWAYRCHDSTNFAGRVVAIVEEAYADYPESSAPADGGWIGISGPNASAALHPDWPFNNPGATTAYWKYSLAAVLGVDQTSISGQRTRTDLGNGYIKFQCDFEVAGEARDAFSFSANEHSTQPIGEDPVECDGGAYLPYCNYTRLYLGQTDSIVDWIYDSKLTFGGITIPQGAIINKALIEIEHLYQGGPAGDIQTFIDSACTSIASAPSDSTCSSDQTWWDSERGQWAVPWKITKLDSTSSPTTITSPNIACMVQDFIDQENWESGRAVELFLNYGDEAGTDGTTIESYTSFTEESAALRVWYTYVATYTPSGGAKGGGGNIQPIIRSTYTPSGGGKGGGSVQPHIVKTHVTSGGAKGGGSAGAVLLGNPWPNGFLYRREMTIPDGAVTEDLNKFWVPVHGSIEPSHSNGSFQVTDTNGNVLSHEVRYYSEGDFVIVFKTSVSTAGETFYLYYGELTA